jgi:hypothetical protein
MATMEDLHHLCPWVVLATHDVGDRSSLLSVCFFSLLSARRIYVLRTAQGCMTTVLRLRRLVWCGIALYPCHAILYRIYALRAFRSFDVPVPVSHR